MADDHTVWTPSLWTSRPSQRSTDFLHCSIPGRTLVLHSELSAIISRMASVFQKYVFPDPDLENLVNFKLWTFSGNLQIGSNSVDRGKKIKDNDNLTISLVVRTKVMSRNMRWFRRWSIGLRINFSGNMTPNSRIFSNPVHLSAASHFGVFRMLKLAKLCEIIWIRTVWQVSAFWRTLLCFRLYSRSTWCRLSSADNAREIFHV